MLENKQTQIIGENVKMDSLPPDHEYEIFREKYLKTLEILNNDPDAYITDCGVIIRAKQLDETELRLSNTSFGRRENVINSVAFTLIKLLKDNASNVDMDRMDYLNGYLGFLESVAKEAFVGNVIR